MVAVPRVRRERDLANCPGQEQCGTSIHAQPPTNIASPHVSCQFFYQRRSNTVESTSSRIVSERSVSCGERTNKQATEECDIGWVANRDIGPVWVIPWAYRHFVLYVNAPVSSAGKYPSSTSDESAFCAVLRTHRPSGVAWCSRPIGRFLGVGNAYKSSSVRLTAVFLLSHIYNHEEGCSHTHTHTHLLMSSCSIIRRRPQRIVTWIIKHSFDVFLNRSHRYMYVNSLTKIQPLLDSATENLFGKMQSPDHCLHILLTPDRPLNNILRSRGHGFELARCSLDFHKRSFVVNCLFRFIDMWICFYSCMYCQL